MKKKDFRIMSDVTCRCGKQIKQNLVDRKVNPPEMCYSCHIKHEALGGHRMQGIEGIYPKPTFKRGGGAYGAYYPVGGPS